MLDYNLFKPIRNFGLLVFFIGALGLAFAAFHNDYDLYWEMRFSFGCVSAFHLFAGYSIASRNRFGFRSLKLYLYLLYPGFPIGYLYAKKTLEYIKTHNIEAFYRKSLKL